MKKAIVLFSGGLDSILATRLLQEQEFEIIGLNFVTPFHDDTASAKKAAEALGIELVIHRTGDDYVRLIAHPRWGYGKAVNPCIDCRIEMCHVARKLMEERGAQLVATGELAGQRPNSQMQHQLNLISRQSGLEDCLLRPLSAQVLSTTRVEREGLVDRTRLLGYTGRGRGRLIALAHRMGVKKIPQPSTGCFLCEKSYAPRLHDLFKYEPNPTDWDAMILNVGRQIRISPTVKAVLGRNEEHCDRLAELAQRADARPSILLIPESFNGTTCLMVGPDSKQMEPELFDEQIRLGAALVFRFTNPNKYNPAEATLIVQYGNTREIRHAEPDDRANEYRVI